ncbi:DUF4433 domain-containing protein [Cryobacterium sp. TMT4-10]|nr:DUF4433 domain-containing protein [Cryobacterium sp. TMT4-10]
MVRPARPGGAAAARSRQLPAPVGDGPDGPLPGEHSRGPQPAEPGPDRAGRWPVRAAGARPPGAAPDRGARARAGAGWGDRCPPDHDLPLARAGDRPAGRADAPDPVGRSGAGNAPVVVDQTGVFRRDGGGPVPAVGPARPTGMAGPAADRRSGRGRLGGLGLHPADRAGAVLPDGVRAECVGRGDRNAGARRIRRSAENAPNGHHPGRNDRTVDTWSLSIGLEECGGHAHERFSLVLSDECIHGLEGGLCALCFPKAAPEIVPAVPAVRASRAKSAKAPSLRSSPSPRTVTLGGTKTVPVAKAAGTVKASPVRVSGAAKTAVDNVGEQRIYHVTHIRNLAGILGSGRLLADASDAWETRPAVDLSSVLTRAARRAAVVTEADDTRVAAYVPFFLSPNAYLWDGILTGATDPRLSGQAHDAEIFDFVILVSTVKKLRDDLATADEPAAAAVVVTDADAAGPLTSFSAAPESADRLLRRLRADQESGAIRAAELLVSEQFPFQLVTLIGVANDKVRDAVRGILAAGAHKPKVAVYPPWFHAADESDAQ